MELREKAVEMSRRLAEAVEEWASGRIDQLAQDSPGVGIVSKYLKRGVSNIVSRFGSEMDKATDILLMFVEDKDGKCDMDSLFDDALSMFSQMPERPFSFGFLHGTAGKGAVRIELPDNPVVGMVFGDTGALRITGEDLSELKDIILNKLSVTQQRTTDSL